jgi:hypothetical protein
MHGVLHAFWPCFDENASFEFSDGDFEKERSWLLWSEPFGGGDEPCGGDRDGAVGALTE